MKILFFISSMEGGGAQRVLWSLANYFCQKVGYDIFVVADFSSTIAYDFDEKVRLIDLEEG